MAAPACKLVPPLTKMDGNRGHPMWSQGDADTQGGTANIQQGLPPASINPITVQGEEGNWNEDQEAPALVNRKKHAKLNLAKANAHVPSAIAPPLEDPNNTHILLLSNTTSHIAPMFVQVTTAHMLKQQASVQGFCTVASKAQNHKDSRMP